MSAEFPPPFAVGLRHSEHLVVEPRHSVPAVDPSWPGFQDMPPVLATAMMVGFIEHTCIMALKPFLPPEQRTVGTHVNVSHVAATPIGMRIKAVVELVGIEKRALEFKVACFDESGLIGEGIHQRAIIDVARFIQRVHAKASGAS